MIAAPKSASAHVLSLQDAGERGRCGGKASRLAELIAAGLPVPAGFVLTVDVSREVARANELSPASDAAAVAHARVPEAIGAAIERAWAALGRGAVAVRSSAIAEDLASASFAGLYESVLDVRELEDLLAAVRSVWASAHAARVRAYGATGGFEAMAVIVQRMVPADTAGVVFTADPVTGARDVAIVSAVRGLGDALVSGTTTAEEWRLGPDRAERIRDNGVLDEATAVTIAALARSIAEHAGVPQDVEWAIANGELSIVQARPMTALPETPCWDVPEGGFIRNFRLGEWIGDPVTPAFESWLLTDIERGLERYFLDVAGIAMPGPSHVVVNGWYFYNLAFTRGRFGRLRFALQVPRMLFKMATKFRANAALIPPLAHLGFDHVVREWRDQLAPAYRALVAEATAAIPSVPIEEVPGWIDRIAACAGRNFGSVVGVAGYAAKAELPLVELWKKHLTAIEGSWLEVVRTGDAPEPAAHDVQGLDWYLPTLGELAVTGAPPDRATRARIVAERDAVVERARGALTPKLCKQFDRRLAEAQRAHAIREEQARELTLAWPVLRVAMRRIGDHLCARGVIAEVDQIFFLERAEIAAALTGDLTSRAAVAASRLATWQRQRRLAVPLVVGTLPPFFAKVFGMIEQVLHGDAPKHANELRGHPGSPGRVTGRVRILRSPDELARLQPGEILVATVTTPAWTPAFPRAAAIVTDTGSIASHASIVAREYGLPAVVATGDATSRLRDGQVITVDGSRGIVRL